MTLKFSDIKEHNFLLAPFNYSNSTTTERIAMLRKKYDNLMEQMESMDGYAFDSREMYAENNTGSLIPLIQIGNVNELEYNLNKTQKFVYVSTKYLNMKSGYSLKKESVLISLTGGADKCRDISIYFDGAQQYLLNQRVCAYYLHKGVHKDILYYFYGLTFSSLFKEQWMGTGGIQKNTGKRERQSLYLPLIKDQNKIKYISLLTQALVNKSRVIAEKYQKISTLVNKEILENQSAEVFSYSPVTFHELLENERLDSKTYSKRYKEIEFKIKNYKKGFFYIPNSKIKGGSTPKKRFIKEDDSLNYYWVTPTIFSDIGLLSQKHTINCQSANISTNCLLLVNRTSKGADGKYVGMSFFYNKDKLGYGQYNQGLYSIQDYSDEDLYFFNALINSQYYRILFGQLSLGSKMKEIKVKQLTQVPFPNFESRKKKEIINLYHNAISYNASECTVNNFSNYDAEFNISAGIYEIDESMRYIRKILDKAIKSVIDDTYIDTVFSLK